MYRAFTILELLVVLIISAIVIGIGAACYVIVDKSIMNYMTINKNINNSFLFNSVLYHDVHSSDVLLKTDRGIRMIKIAFPETEYIVSNGKMIRLSGNVKDTFECIFDKVEYLFESTPVITPENIVDEIICKTIVLNEKDVYHYRKEYDRLTLILNKEINK